MLTQVARSTRHTVTTIHNSRISLCGRDYRCYYSLISSSPPRALSVPPCRNIIAWSRPISSYIQQAPFTHTTSLCRRYLISEGTTTVPKDDTPTSPPTKSPFYFETGYSIFAKRPSRAFPPPFVSLPSGSFSDPLTNHNQPVRGRRPQWNGVPVRGITNGDDAILIGNANFLAVNDGVGAWAQKERGHAALWSRLIAHFWGVEVEKAFAASADIKVEDLNPIQNLETAYNETKLATKGRAGGLAAADAAASGDFGGQKEKDAVNSSSKGKEKPKSKDKDKESDSNDILGTTTACSALLYFQPTTPEPTPVVLATTLGDCKVLILRPSTSKVLYRSTEQWHWFDCPRQLGTNSPDTPVTNAVTDVVPVEVNDVIAVLSDGVTDNLWEHEICANICESIKKWEAGEDPAAAQDGIVFVARQLMNAAKEIAMDPNAESPYMERAFDEGIAAEGGKLDDISVVLGIVRRKKDD